MPTSEQSQRDQGAMLRTMRKAAGVSQSQLASRLNLSPGQLSRIENGAHPLGPARLHAATSYIAEITRGAA